MTDSASGPLDEVSKWIDTQISIITCDGRNIIGKLRGFDQTINLILTECHERILMMNPAESQRIDLGLYLIRGDNVALIGPFDEAKDRALNIIGRSAKSIMPVTH